MKFFLSILFILGVISGNAQQKPTLNDIILVKEIPAKEYAGLEYELMAEIKSNVTGEEGKAGLSVLQIGKNKWDYIEDTRKIPSPLPHNNGWQKSIISGVIDAKASKIWLYLHTYGNGDFYFDNIEMKIKNKEGKWLNVVVENGDFEMSSTKNPFKGLSNVKSIEGKKDVKASLFFNADAKYNQSLYIHAENAKIDERVVYGYNKKAGAYVKVNNGKRIYYETYGNGEPLLLLHGNGGSINSFWQQIPAFSQKYKVIAIDTRGQGNSKDLTTENFSYNLFAEDLKTVLDTLHLKNVNILGWSDGGNTGLILASKYPDYVKKLITMGANLNPTETALSKKILIQTAKDIKRLKEENKASNTVIIRLLEMLLKEPDIKPEQLKSVKAKTLVIAGGKDLILENHTRLIAKSIPDAQLILLKGQTHYVVTENPTLFNKTVLTFLEE
ncbi:alpha/beta hydrolase [Pedobacter nototheniae]|uniref:alpha/beta fold hydrolase n=1 Tax=Pedobacter nototheniae TaxID=2488994 RepID=UPI0029318C37|nr:alpha/beta hydrolase [Pedobacter nototheniae]